MTISGTTDARSQRVKLVCPCGRSSRTKYLCNVATDVLTFTCRVCGFWRVVSRPLSSSAKAVVRQVEWIRPNETPDLAHHGDETRSRVGKA